ncbi:TonB family protein [Stenotrophomonas sp. PS02300]|uniref:TonB family protein n=1 Tax=Stenotrophomonas sp. PS02300 TaxID=2991426 RepID=UPI00249BD524|nr:TonB family protein [Stenotrophomonas sp. PS02300]
MRYPHFLALALALGGTGLVATSDTAAQTARAVRETAEASMTLTGKIDIGTDGHVTSFQLDHADKLPADLAAFVQRQVQAWQFRPAVENGTAVATQTPVTLRLLSQSSPDGAGDTVRVAGASFSKYDPDDTSRVTSSEIRSPTYPKTLAAMRAKGEVLLLLKVGRDGTVDDVVAEQVNLRVVGKESQMRQVRNEFARASVSTARSWTFRPPTTGKLKDAESWTVRIPVRYMMGERTPYGTWEAYIPGPRERAPWRTSQAGAEAAPDLLAAGGIYMADLDDGPRLLTPLGS